MHICIGYKMILKDMFSAYIICQLKAVCMSMSSNYFYVLDFKVFSCVLFYISLVVP